MSGARTVARNAAWLMGQKVLMGVFSVMVVAVVARYLGTERYGALVLLISYQALLAQVASLGLRPYGVRVMAADRSGLVAFLEEMLALRTALAAGVAVLAAGWLVWFDTLLPDSLIAVLVAQLVLNAIGMCYLDGLYGLERIKEVAKVLGVSGMAVQLASLAAVALDAGLVGVGCAYVAGGLVTLVTALRFLRAHTGPVGIRMPHRGQLAHVRASRAFFLQNIVHTVRARLDIVLITYLAGAHAAGVYGASLTLVQRLDMVQDALTTALFPRVASANGLATDEVRELGRLSFRLVLAFSLPLAIGIAGTAPDIVGLVFGGKFADASPVLTAIALSLPFGFTYGLLYNVLSALGRQETVFRLALAALVPGLAAMAAGVAFAGAAGAAVAYVLIVIGLTVPLAVVYRRDVGPLAAGGDLLRVAAANAAMGSVLALTAGWPFAARVAACVATYAVALPATGVVTFATLRAAFRRRD